MKTRPVKGKSGSHPKPRKILALKEKSRVPFTHTHTQESVWVMGRVRHGFPFILRVEPCSRGPGPSRTTGPTDLTCKVLAYFGPPRASHEGQSPCPLRPQPHPSNPKLHVDSHPEQLTLHRAPRAHLVQSHPAVLAPCTPEHLRAPLFHTCWSWMVLLLFNSRVVPALLNP
jgi:hypothetical protein